jgi:hypothetical protein
MFGFGAARVWERTPVTKVSSRAPAPRDESSLPALSSDEMSSILQRCGARVVARTDHGQLLAAHRRLIFVRHTDALPTDELGDIVRTAWIAPARVRELLEEMRSAK